MNPQSTDPCDTFFQDRELIAISFQSLTLFARGFTSTQVFMSRDKGQKGILDRLFEIRLAQTHQGTYLLYHQPLYIVHYLSQKYLCASTDFSSKCQLRLRTAPTANCLFTIKPLYKCQVSVSTEIHRGEQVILASFGSEMGLVVNRFQVHNKFAVHLKKNEHSAIVLERRSVARIRQAQPPGKTDRISTFGRYQLRNMESGKVLEIMKDKAIFRKEPEGYSSLIMLVYRSLEVETHEQLLEAHREVSVQFYAGKQFLSIDIGGEATLVQHSTQQAVFLVEPYKEETVAVSSICRLKHKYTNRYLSISRESQVTVQEFKLSNTFSFEVIDREVLNSTLFVNEVQAVLSKQTSHDHKLSFENKKHLRTVLLEIIKFTFKNKRAEELFLTLSELPTAIRPYEEMLFVQTGALNSLCVTAAKLVTELKQEGDHFEDELQLLQETLLALSGLCRSQASAKVFCQYLPLLYESMLIRQGILECLVHICRGKECLSVIEATSHCLTVQKKKSLMSRKIKSIELLLETVVGKELQHQCRIKILKLFQALAVSDLLQPFILNVYRSTTYANIFLSVSAVNNDLIIIQEGRTDELEDLTLIDKSKPIVEQLVQQIKLLSRLCQHTQKNYFRESMPPSVLYRYLRASTPKELKQLLFQVLFNNYFPIHGESTAILILSTQTRSKMSSFPEDTLSARLVREEEEQSHEMQEVRSDPSLQKIYKLVKEIVVKELRDPNEELLLSLQALRRCVELGVIKTEDLQKRLQEFLLGHCREKMGEVKMRIVAIELLQILQAQKRRWLLEKSNSLIRRIQQLSGDSSKEQLARAVHEIMLEEDEGLCETEIITLLHDYVEYPEMVLPLSELLRLECDRENIMIEFLKDKVIVGSDWSSQFYERASRRGRELVRQIEEYRTCGDPERVILVLKQLNSLYQLEDSRVSSFAQSIFRELHLSSHILKALMIKQSQLTEPQHAPFFAECFKFLRLFIYDSQTNFLHIRDQLPSIAPIFRLPDRGQIEIIAQISNSDIGQKFLQPFMFQALTDSLAANSPPNFSAIVSLLNIIARGDFLTEMEDFLRKDISLLKLQERGAREWGEYIGLVCRVVSLVLAGNDKLVLERIQTSFPLQDMMECIQKYLVEECDILTAQQLMDLCDQVHREQLRSMPKSEYVLGFIQKVVNKVTKQKPIQSNHTPRALGAISKVNILSKQKAQKGSDLQALSEEKLGSQVYINITIVLPFLSKLLQRLGSSGSHERELGLTVNTVHQKFRDYITSRLTYGQFLRYPREYRSAISTSEALLGRSLGMSYAAEEDVSEEDEEIVERVYFNKKIENTLQNYTQAATPQEQKLYRAVLIILHTYQPSNPTLPRISLSKGDFPNIVARLCAGGHFALVHFYFLHYHQSLNNYAAAESTFQQPTTLRFVLEDESLFNIYLQLDTALCHVQFEQAEGHMVRSEIESTICRKVERLIMKEIALHEQKDVYGQSEHYSRSRRLAYETYTRSLCIETVLEWLKAKASLNCFDARLIHCTYNLLRSYVKFMNSFQRKYISKEIVAKTELCVSTLYLFAMASEDNLVSLCEHQIYEEINDILGLDDTLKKTVDELDYDVPALLKILLKYHFQSSSYLKRIAIMHANSVKIYGDALEEFPLLPTRGYFKDIKHITILLLKQFLLLPEAPRVQLFSRLSLKEIDAQILEAYRTHQALFGTVTPASTSTDIVYSSTDRLYNVANNFSLWNAVELTAIKIKIDPLNELQAKYVTMRIAIVKAKQRDTFVSMLWEFLRGLVVLFVHACKPRSKKKEGTLEEAVHFFMKMVGTVEVMDESRLISWNFVLLPESLNEAKIKHYFIQSLNFISVQLKRESIMQSANYFMLYYRNEHNFFRKYSFIPFACFFDTHITILRLTSYLLTIICNILLLADSSITAQQFVQFQMDAFGVLAIWNIVNCSLIFFLFVLKEIPFVIMTAESSLLAGRGYFGLRYSYQSVTKQRLILFLKMASDGNVIYNTLFTAMVFLVVFNKLFVTLLLIDVLSHIPALNKLLNSLWKPKFELILAVIAFTIVQYFFSIFMFFNFKTEAHGYCDKVGQCFAFLFITTYKTFAGFVGYLFDLNTNADLSIDLKVTVFEIFQDIYVILIYQIFFSLILAIVIDSFTVDGAERLKRKENIESSCIVCNLDRSIFNVSSTLSFRGHISVNHNIFNYFALRYCLQWRSKLRLNYFEREALLNKTADWLPNQEAIEIVAK